MEKINKILFIVFLIIIFPFIIKFGVLVITVAINMWVNILGWFYETKKRRKLVKDKFREDGKRDGS